MKTLKKHMYVSSHQLRVLLDGDALLSAALHKSSWQQVALHDDISVKVSISCIAVQLKLLHWELGRHVACITFTANRKLCYWVAGSFRATCI